MASLDSLTDGELRTQLTSLGCDVGPVTPTTRKLYLKKLKKLLDDPNTSSTSASNNLNDSNDTFVSQKVARPKTPPRQKSPSRKPDILGPLANSTFADSPSRATAPRVDIPDAGASQIPGYASPLVSSSVGRVSSMPEERSELSGSYSLPFRITNPGLFCSKRHVSPTSFKKDFDSSQPYSSEFARQISMSVAASRLAGSNVSPRAGINSKPYDKYDSVKENDSEDEDPDRPEPTYAKFNRSSRSSQRGNGSSYMVPGEKWYGKDASLLILGATALFFVIIGYIYFHMHHYPSTQISPQVSEISYPRCDSLSVDPYDNSCIPDRMIKPVTMIFRLVHKELHDMASRAGCHPPELPFLYKLDIEKLVSEKETEMTLWDIEDYVQRLRLLIGSNPKWNLISTSDGVRLRSITPSLYCTIVGYLVAAADWLIRLAILAGIIVLGYYVFRWYTDRQAALRAEVCCLAADIVQTVSEKSADGFAVINHARDALIAPADRQRMAPLWKEAEAMLETDSRIRKEVQLIDGEEFSVWRWVTPTNPPKNKGWQGQAFETMEGSPNSVPESPTPFLKIRHMFDPSQEAGDKWVAGVADAVLEKCRGAAIVHIVVDKGSKEGCVYVKCASHADAGIAYRALHGSWFNSKLVTVKYIREQRYLQRFPDSAQARYPLSSITKSRL